MSPKKKVAAKKTARKTARKRAVPAKKVAKSKPGPPKWEPNLAEVEKLSARYATYEEIAAFFGVSVSLVNKEVARNPEFKEAIDKGQAKGRLSLRGKQFELALAGDKTMLIWLGKQLLGQSQSGTAEKEKEEEDPLDQFLPENRIVPMGRAAGH